MRPHPSANVLSVRVRQAVIERDAGRCRLCARAKSVQVHHVDGRGNRHRDPNHDPQNLVTLCRSCHRRVHTEQVRLTPELLDRASRIRAGTEVLVARPAERIEDSRLVGNTIPDYVHLGMRPEVAFFVEHPEDDCPRDCECGAGLERQLRPFSGRRRYS